MSDPRREKKRRSITVRADPDEIQAVHDKAAKHKITVSSLMLAATFDAGPRVIARAKKMNQARKDEGSAAKSATYRAKREAAEDG